MYKLQNINIRYGAKCKVHKNIHDEQFVISALHALQVRIGSERYRKTRKNLDIWKNCCNYPKTGTIILLQSNGFKRCRLVSKQSRPWSDSSRSSLIWVYTVCLDLSVENLWSLWCPNRNCNSPSEWLSFRHFTSKLSRSRVLLHSCVCVNCTCLIISTLWLKLL